MNRSSLVCCLVLLGLLVPGCLSQAAIDEQLAACPRFVQDNVGEIKYQPFSPLSLLMINGMTNKRTGEIRLFALADRNTVLHEAAHSVYFRAADTEQFYEDFSRMSRPKAHNSVILFAIPAAGYLPCKDFRNIYAGSNMYEDMAECFVAGMRDEEGSELFNKKVDRVMEFYRNGK